MPGPDIPMDSLDKRNDDFGIGMKMQIQAGNSQWGEE
jgi:hypothetical protein